MAKTERRQPAESAPAVPMAKTYSGSCPKHLRRVSLGGFDPAVSPFPRCRTCGELLRVFVAADEEAA